MVKKTEAQDIYFKKIMEILRMEKKLRILFLCTGNSCRSQMAEGWTRALKGDIIEAFSAGIEIHGLNQDAVDIMAEAGVDISQNRSKHVNEFVNTDLDVVVTVCGHAHETCPYFPASCKLVHVGFEDPPKMAEKLAQQGADKEIQLDCFRRVRDEIRAFVEKLPENLTR
jgi:arsenate reductase